MVLERGSWTSYSACGIPYWISGEVGSPEALVARTREDHRANGIDLRMGVEATAIDPVARTVSIRGGDDLAYDRLVIATGAEPVRPDLPGIDGDGIYGVQTLDDGQALIDGLASQPEQGRGRRVRLCRARDRRGLRGARLRHHRHRPLEAPLSIIEPQLGEQIADAMRKRGIRLLVATPRSPGSPSTSGPRERRDDEGRVDRRRSRRPRARCHRPVRPGRRRRPAARRQGRHRRRRAPTGAPASTTSGRPATAS